MSNYHKDLMPNGIYCIEYSQLGSPGMLIRLAKHIGIEWLVVADGDMEGNSYVKSAKKELGDEGANERIQLLDHNIDVLLCMKGYGSHYERFVDDLPDNNDMVNYWTTVSGTKMKVRAAAAAVADMEKQGSQSIPDIIRRIIDIATRLAGRQ